jgi:hypothetical protein
METVAKLLLREYATKLSDFELETSQQELHGYRGQPYYEG